MYHLSTKPISRSSGRTATASIAYRAGITITDERTGVTYDYSKRTGVIGTQLHTPNGITLDRNQLWNLAELSETRKNSRTARETVIHIPHELMQGAGDAGKQLAFDFGKHLSDKYGIAVDVAVHAPDRHGDQRNYHAHILMTTRKLEQTADGKISLGEKSQLEMSNTQLKQLGLLSCQDELKEIRETWADFANKALAEQNIDKRIDHRSHKDRGLETLPTIKMGWQATELERKGINTSAGDYNRAIKEYNKALLDWYNEVNKYLDDKLEQVKPIDRTTNKGASYDFDNTRLDAINQQIAGRERAIDSRKSEIDRAEQDAGQQFLAIEQRSHRNAEIERHIEQRSTETAINSHEVATREPQLDSTARTIERHQRAIEQRKSTLTSIIERIRAEFANAKERLAEKIAQKRTETPTINDKQADGGYVPPTPSEPPKTLKFDAQDAIQKLVDDKVYRTTMDKTLSPAEKSEFWRLAMQKGIIVDDYEPTQADINSGAGGVLMLELRNQYQEKLDLKQRYGTEIKALEQQLEQLEQSEPQGIWAKMTLKHDAWATSVSQTKTELRLKKDSFSDALKTRNEFINDAKSQVVSTQKRIEQSKNTPKITPKQEFEQLKAKLPANDKVKVEAIRQLIEHQHADNPKAVQAGYDKLNTAIKNGTISKLDDAPQQAVQQEIEIKLAKSQDKDRGR